MQSQPRLSPLKFHVVFLATSTDEKIRDFNIAAEHKGLALKFFNLRKLVGTLHNTLEEGDSADANANSKLVGIKEKIDYCRSDEALVTQFCESQGISYDCNRVWFGTEDSGTTLPPEIWNNIPEEAFSVLSDEVRVRLKHQGLGPGVETAPFLSAMLGTGNIHYLIEEGLKKYAEKNNYFVDLNKLKFTEESVLKLEGMVAKIHNNAPQIEVFSPLTARGVVENNYANSPYTHPDEVGGRVGNYGLIRPSKRKISDKTAAELGVKYIAKHGSRAACIDDLVVKINTSVDENHHLNPIRGKQKYDLVTDIAANPKEFNVGLLNIDSSKAGSRLIGLLNKESHIKADYIPDNESPPKGISDLEKAEFYLSYPERALAKSDGLVLMPDSASVNRTSLQEKLYLLMSIVVAKQLVPRDMEKPVVIINTDHSWDEAIRIHTALAKCQMTKDHALPLHWQLPDVSVTSNAYFDMINNDNYEAALKGASVLIKDKSLRYHRTQDHPTQVSRKGAEVDDRRDLVAVFCSASSENAQLNGLVSGITSRLAAANVGIICGGGDRYTMGAILDGVKDQRLAISTKIKKLNKQEIKDRTYIAGISTEPIAASETNTGTIPDDYNTQELSKNIYARMAKMLVCSKKILVAPGGAGTIQEWMGFHVLKNKMPELFKHKELVIFDPPLMPQELAPKDMNVSAGNARRVNPFVQNQVFDEIIKFVYPSNKNTFWLNKPHNNTGINICKTPDDVMLNLEIEETSIKKRN